MNSRPLKSITVSLSLQLKMILPRTKLDRHEDKDACLTPQSRWFPINSWANEKKSSNLNRTINSSKLILIYILFLEKERKIMFFFYYLFRCNDWLTYFWLMPQHFTNVWVVRNPFSFWHGAKGKQRIQFGLLDIFLLVRVNDRYCWCLFCVGSAIEEFTVRLGYFFDYVWCLWSHVWVKDVR